MQKLVTLTALVAFAGTLAACGGPEPEPVPTIVDPAPISVEPAYTGKYK